MAQLITYKCPICHIQRAIWDTEYRDGWRCCYADKTVAKKRKPPRKEDITQPVLYRLAGLAENRKLRTGTETTGTDQDRS